MKVKCAWRPEDGVQRYSENQHKKDFLYLYITITDASCKDEASYLFNNIVDYLELNSNYDYTPQYLSSWQAEDETMKSKFSNAIAIQRHHGNVVEQKRDILSHIEKFTESIE